MLKSKIKFKLVKRFKNIIGIKETTKEPKLPDTVLFGLIFVSFLPPKKLPNTYPPISELAHMLNINVMNKASSKVSPRRLNAENVTNIK